MKVRRLKQPVQPTRKRWSLLAVPVALSLVLTALLISVVPVGATDYTFGNEQIDYGGTADTGNKDTANGIYETISELDSASDTDYNNPSKSITTGTEGGTFPDNIQTDNEQYWTLTEASAADTPYDLYRFPDGDSSVEWDDVFPVSPTTHYDKVDEAVHDSSTTYISTDTGGDEDRFTLADMTEPAGGYDLDVTVFAVHQKDSNPGANFAAGIRIGSTNYGGISENPANGAWANTSSTAWTINPSTSSEWTYSEVNALLVYITTDDASPTVYCTQIGIKISVSFVQNYRAEAELTWSSTATDSDTLKFSAIIQAKTSAESFYLQFWDYIGGDWTTRRTVSATSDTDYDYDLTTDERSGAGEIKLRILDATDTGDTVQDVISLDLTLIRRVDVYYRASVQMSTSAVVPDQDLALIVKGYTDDGESWAVELWNYTSSGWDSELTFTELSNTEKSSPIVNEHQLSGSIVKCRFDNQGSPDMTTASEFYLDFVAVRTLNAEPVLSQMGENGPNNLGETATFWAIYTDSDNDAPEYMRVMIDSSPYAMIKNGTDEDYTDGCEYYYSTAALSGGDHPYYFACKDASHSETTGGADTYTVNRIPELANDQIDPLAGSNGDWFTFSAEYWDADNDAPLYFKVNIDDTDYDCTAWEPGDEDYTDGKGYFYDKQLAGGPHTFYFKCADYLSGDVTSTPDEIDINNKPTLGTFSREPAGTCYPTTLVYFNCTFTDIDGDLPDPIKWREGGGTTQNVTMSEVSAGDTDTTDGKDYTVSMYLSHGLHEYDFYASDGVEESTVTGGSDSITIGNQDPVITDDPGADEHIWRNTYWSYDFDATDGDDDTVTWEYSTNATWLSITESTGLVYGTSSDPVAWYDLTVYANDSYGGSDDHYCQIYVDNREPVITSSGNTTQLTGSFMAYHITYTEADSDAVVIEFNSNATFLSLENEWLNGTATPAGIYWINVWANDSYGGSDLQEWDLTVGNQAPYFTSTPTYSVQNASFYSYLAVAVDPDELTVTYSLDSNATWLEIDEALGYVNGTADLVGSYWVNVTASDGLLTCSQNYSLDVLNTAPDISSTPVATGNVGVQYDYTILASDVNDDTLTYHLDTKPEWLFINEATGEISGTPTEDGLFPVKAYVSDGYTVTWQNWTLNIPDPTPEPPPPTPIEVAQEGMESIIAAAIALMIFGMLASVFFIRKRRKKNG